MMGDTVWREVGGGYCAENMKTDQGAAREELPQHLPSNGNVPHGLLGSAAQLLPPRLGVVYLPPLLNRHQIELHMHKHVHRQQ